jgi:hypothetical protein
VSIFISALSSGNSSSASLLAGEHRALRVGKIRDVASIVKLAPSTLLAKMCLDEPRRVLTHMNQRKLTSEQVYFLLAAYVATDTTYRALGEKYGVSQLTVSKIVRGLSYRELSGISHLREQARKKASSRFARHSSAEGMRVPDPRLIVIEVDPTSKESAYAALRRIQNICSQLVSAAEEGSYD